MFIGILNTTLQVLKLIWAAFRLRHILSWWFHSQNYSSKLKSVFNIPLFEATTEVSVSL